MAVNLGKIKIALSFVLLLILSNTTVYSQINKRGLPFITNYPAKTYKGAEQNWAVVQDKRGLMYFGNNDNGILEYDGVSWRQIPLANSSIVRSLAVDTNGVVYVGAVGDFGYLAPDETGNMHYKSLLHLLDTAVEFSDVWKTYSSSKGVYFCTIQNIFLYKDNEITVIKTPGNAIFSFLINEELFIPSISEGIFKLDDTSKVFLPKTEEYKNRGVYTMNWFQNKLLIGDEAYGLNYYDTLEHSITKALNNSSLKSLLNNDFLYSSCLYDTNRMLLGTLYGGIALVDEKGKIINHYNKQTGLDDETITAICKDNNGDVWLSLNDGIAKVEENSPFRFFSDKNGVEGYITSICRFNNRLFLGTPLGVFYLESKPNKTPRFIKMPEIKTQAWSLLLYNNNGKEQMFIGTTKGLFSVDKNFKVSLLDEQILKGKRGTYNIQKVYASKVRPNYVFVGLNTGAFAISNSGKTWEKKCTFNFNKNVNISNIHEDKYGNVWFSTFMQGLAKSEGGDSSKVVFYGIEQGLPDIRKLFIGNVEDKVTVGTENGMFVYDEEKDSFVRDTRFGNFNSSVYFFEEDLWGNLWISAHDVSKRWLVRFTKISEGVYEEDRQLLNRLPKEQFDYAFAEEDGTVWLGSASGLYTFDNNFSEKEISKYNCLIRQVVVNLDSVIFNGTNFEQTESGLQIPSLNQNKVSIPTLAYKFNNLSFLFSSAWYVQEKETQYSYMLEGYDSKWRKWNAEPKAVFTNLSEGEYTFKVKSRNIFGLESNVAEYSFSISPPIHRTIVAYILYILLAALLMYSILKIYTRRLAQEKIRLEKIVQERTSEIREQNVQLQEQKEEILKQKEEITASIHYAERIQQAIVPSREDAKKLLKDYFLLWKPRDIVSGDFWWMGEKDGYVVVTAADCTGHGVPGAFMSMLGVSFLNEIVKQQSILNSGDILNELRNKVKVTLGQTNEVNSSKDGMDMGLLVFDFNNMKAQFSGAYNPLYLFRNGELIETKATRNPIAIYIKEKDFAQTEIELQKGDTLYVFSDGFPDQFGGESGKKYSTKRFKVFLQSIQDKTMEEQQQLLDEEIINWRGEIEQIDDIIILGIRI